MAELVLCEVLVADEDYFAAHGEWGRCLLRPKSYPKAELSLKRAIQLDPGAMRIQSMLGAILLLQGEYAAAVDAQQLVVRLNSQQYQN